MELKINKNSGIPLYKQVKNALTEQIRSGELAAGFRLPTERELSEILGLSRNTISAAYKDLEKEGLLTSRQGKGTFVIEGAAPVIPGELRERILRYLDMSMEEAATGGMAARDFLGMVEKRVADRMEVLNRSRAVYVECNPEQARSYAYQIESATGMECAPLTVGELIEMSEDTRSVLRAARVIIATSNHVPEVLEYLRDFGKEVLGVAANPDLRTMVSLARYPRGTRFAFLCISDAFMNKVRRAFQEAGLDDLDIQYSNTMDPLELEAMVRDRDIILVSPGRRRDLAGFAEPERVISLEYNLDEGSLTTLRQRLLEICPA